MTSLKECVPKNKHDVDAVVRAAELGFPHIIPILPELLGWIQDINWPVASPIMTLLASSGPEIAPHVSSVLRSDDDVWKHAVLMAAMEFKLDVVRQMRSDLRRLSDYPTEREAAEELDVLAGALLLRDGR